MKADKIAKHITTNTLLINLMMGMSQDELEDTLRYIDNIFETNVFND